MNEHVDTFDILCMIWMNGDAVYVIAKMKCQANNIWYRLALQFVSNEQKKIGKFHVDRQCVENDAGKAYRII